jgi:P-type Ca2+ transporter type 2C
VKGASEIVLESCSQFQSFDGSVVQMDTTMKTNIENAIANMANSALRTIIIAKKNLTGSENMDNKDNKDVYEVETSGFTMISLLGIKDVLR